MWVMFIAVCKNNHYMIYYISLCCGLANLYCLAVSDSFPPRTECYCWWSKYANMEVWKLLFYKHYCQYDFEFHQSVKKYSKTIKCLHFKIWMSVNKLGFHVVFMHAAIINMQLCLSSGISFQKKVICLLDVYAKGSIVNSHW